MDQYLTNNKRIIPMVIFIDEDGNELAKWGPMAPEIAAYSNDLKQDLPNKEDETYKEAFQKYIQKVSDRFTNDESFWNAFYIDIANSITSITLDVTISYITLKYTYVLLFIPNDSLHSIKTAVEQAHYQLHTKSGPGSEYTGWINLPDTYDVDEFRKIQTTA